MPVVCVNEAGCLLRILRMPVPKNPRSAGLNSEALTPFASEKRNEPQEKPSKTNCREAIVRQPPPPRIDHPMAVQVSIHWRLYEHPGNAPHCR